MTLPPDLRARLEAPPFVLLDGGTGGALEDRGVDTNNPLWSSVALLDAAGRDLNRGLHADYVRAGAEVVIANTHNLGAAHCAAYVAAHPELSETAPALQARLHRLALEDARASGAPWVAACLASPDRPYAEQASLTPAEVEAGLMDQWRIIERLAPDLVLFEMLTTGADVAGVSALARGGPARGAGLVCRPDGRLRDGSGLAGAVAQLAEAGFSMAFVQCTAFADVAVPLEVLLRAAESEGLVPGVYANDGRQWHHGAWQGDRVSSDAYIAAAEGWIAAGARIVGGCCGTTPEHIRALNQLRGM